MAYVPWILLVVAVGFYLYACRVLAADAKMSCDVTMGGAMFFSHLWIVGSLAGAAALTMLFDIAWWWGIPIFVALFIAKSFAYSAICSVFLGVEAPPLKDGFKEFIRRTEGKDR